MTANRITVVIWAKITMVVIHLTMVTITMIIQWWFDDDSMMTSALSRYRIHKLEYPRPTNSSITICFPALVCFTCFQLRPGCIIRAAAQVDDELSTLLSLDEDTVGAQNMVAMGGPKQRRRSHHGWSNREFGAMTIACRGIRLTQMKLEDWKQSLLRDHDQETVTWSYVSSLGSTTCLFHATLWFAGVSCPAFGMPEPRNHPALGSASLKHPQWHGLIWNVNYI